jgi:hypothetical protein
VPALALRSGQAVRACAGIQNAALRRGRACFAGAAKRG